MPAINTEDGLRAAITGKPIDPDSVRRYLEEFAQDLPAVREAMQYNRSVCRPSTPRRSHVAAALMHTHNEMPTVWPIQAGPLKVDAQAALLRGRCCFEAVRCRRSLWIGDSIEH